VAGAVGIAERPRAFIGARGRDAEEYLQRMLSNDVEALEEGGSCNALLLTPKARVIAPVRVLRRAPDDFLLITEPALGEVVVSHLRRFRFASRVELELEEHESFVLLGRDVAAPDGGVAIPNPDYGVGALEVLDAPRPHGAAAVPAEELERLRVEAGTPAFGREIDDRVLPAEAGLVERAVSLTKGCYPGQEPLARLHYRGHANRALRRLVLRTSEVPEPETEIRFGDKVVGRVTSAVRSNGRVLALGYVRTEVPGDAELAVGGAVGTALD
jgi:folate-binding protein YgfZ